MVGRLRRWGNWWGRKWMGFVLTAVLCFMAGIFAPAKCDTITFALVSAYGVFVSGHAATDVMAKRSQQAPTAPVKPATPKVTAVKKEEGDDDVD